MSRGATVKRRIVFEKWQLDCILQLFVRIQGNAHAAESRVTGGIDEQASKDNQIYHAHKMNNKNPLALLIYHENEMERRRGITVINGRERRREHVVYLQETWARTTCENLIYKLEWRMWSEVKYWSCGHFDTGILSGPHISYLYLSEIPSSLRDVLWQTKPSTASVHMLIQSAISSFCWLSWADEGFCMFPRKSNLKHDQGPMARVWSQPSIHVYFKTHVYKT